MPEDNFPIKSRSNYVLDNIEKLYFRNFHLIKFQNTFFFQFLNEIGDQLNFPLTVVRGHLEQLSFEAPWWEIPSGGLNVSLDFHGLFLVLEPKEDIDDGELIFHENLHKCEQINTKKNVWI